MAPGRYRSRGLAPHKPRWRFGPTLPWRETYIGSRASPIPPAFPWRSRISRQKIQGPAASRRCRSSPIFANSVRRFASGPEQARDVQLRRVRNDDATISSIAMLGALLKTQQLADFSAFIHSRDLQCLSLRSGSRWGISMSFLNYARFPAILGAAFAAAVCGGAFEPVAAANGVVKFGAPLPLTGPLAPEGIKQQSGYDLWAEQANKAGGLSVAGKNYKAETVY